MEKTKEKVKKSIRNILFIWVMLLSLTLLPTYAQNNTITLNDLIELRNQYDGKVVIVRGETLLEALERKDYVWVNINDGTNAMGVVIPNEYAVKISAYGDYHTKGDFIEIEVLFNKSCNTHGGDMDLHFIRFISITSGYSTEHPIELFRLSMAVISLVSAGLLGFYYQKRFYRVKPINQDSQKG